MKLLRNSEQNLYFNTVNMGLKGNMDF